MPTPLEALAGVTNANEAYPGLLTGGQPTPEHFRALKAAGVTTIIDIRDPMEPRGFDEEALLRELGLVYVVIPVTEATLTDTTLAQVTDAVRSRTEGSALVHCASGNRVGGALIPHLMLDRGFSEDEATTAALRMGLRGAHLLQWGLEYVRTQQG